MIKKIDITGLHTDTDPKLEKYVRKTIGKLEKYIPRKVRSVAHAEVKLIESKKQKDRQFTAEVLMHLPHGTLTAKESTLNMYAAVDIVEAKLHNQLKKYKEKHSDPKFYRRLTSRFRRRNPNQV